MNWKVNQILINFLILFILLLFKGKKAVVFRFFLAADSEKMKCDRNAFHTNWMSCVYTYMYFKFVSYNLTLERNCDKILSLILEIKYNINEKVISWEGKIK